MNKKVVFLDIDGTLMGFDGKLPESTKEALRKAKENGHKMVICSGRSRFQIYPSLLELGFHGIIGGSGAFVDCDGKEIFHQYMEEEQRKWITSYLEEHQFVYSMQAEKGIVINERCKQEMIKLYSGFNLEESRIKRLIGNMDVREDVWNQPKEEKVIYYRAPFPLNKVKEDIAPHFDVVASSFDKEDDYSGEIGIANINKSTGMQIYLDYVGMSKEDTIAIGDGPNDMEMVQFAKIGIAMGNAQQSLKDVANMVTKSIEEDGIYYAFEKLQLI